MIPADEIDRVGEAGPPRAPVAAALDGRFQGMKPSSLVRGGRALPLKPDSLRAVAMRTGTGTPYLRSVLLAADCQLLNQPSR
jgi:hypothetical protein